MTKLSVNINKVATVRNARGGNVPDVVAFALACERFGADGITVHPRPDERHIRRADVYELAERLTTEFNIEGNPTEDFTRLVTSVCPAQVTLVPDAETQLTSDHGWDTKLYQEQLKRLISPFKNKGIRVSVFVDASAEMVAYAASAGADRVELYTGPYAALYHEDEQAAIRMLREAAEEARRQGLGLNAGHDLSLHNLGQLIATYSWIDEVSIGQALISDALYLGIEETIRQYKQQITNHK